MDVAFPGPDAGASDAQPNPFPPSRFKLPESGGRFKARFLIDGSGAIRVPAGFWDARDARHCEIGGDGPWIISCRDEMYYRVDSDPALVDALTAIWRPAGPNLEYAVLEGADGLRAFHRLRFADSEDPCLLVETASSGWRCVPERDTTLSLRYADATCETVSALASRRKDPTTPISWHHVSNEELCVGDSTTVLAAVYRRGEALTGAPTTYQKTASGECRPMDGENLFQATRIALDTFPEIAVETVTTPTLVARIPVVDGWAITPVKWQGRFAPAETFRDCNLMERWCLPRGSIWWSEPGSLSQLFSDGRCETPFLADSLGTRCPVPAGDIVYAGSWNQTPAARRRGAHRTTSTFWWFTHNGRTVCDRADNEVSGFELGPVVEAPMPTLRLVTDM